MSYCCPLAATKPQLTMLELLSAVKPLHRGNGILKTTIDNQIEITIIAAVRTLTKLSPAGFDIPRYLPQRG
jgi:hypothetical protein